MDIHRIKNVIKVEHTLEDHEWEGAVLFLWNKENVFFIRRSATMPTHAGQVGFFGGLKKNGEGSPDAVALREFEEETSLDRHIVDLNGYLPTALTAKGRRIVPVMAHLSMSSEEFFQSIISNGEWDECFAYPWSLLGTEKNWQFALHHSLGKFPVLFHPIKSGTFFAKNNAFQSHLLWGATARMVWNFLRLYYRPS